VYEAGGNIRQDSTHPLDPLYISFLWKIGAGQAANGKRINHFHGLGHHKLIEQRLYIGTWTGSVYEFAEAATRRRNVKETQERTPGVTGLGGVLKGAPDTMDPRGPKAR